MSEAKASDRAGWSITDHGAACDYSRATFYNLPDSLRPRSIKIGKRTVIIESPTDWLQRMASEQEAA